eukprot:530714-Pyramimonas_sp.AAC.1
MRKEMKSCTACGAEKPEAASSGKMWAKIASRQRKCDGCMNGARKEMKSCTACGAEKPEAAFSGEMWAKVASKLRKCDECVKRARNQPGYWKCVQCTNSFETA